jgi:hypothetical protein
VASLDPSILFFDALIIAAILSVPRKVLRYSIQVVAATVISIAILTLTVSHVIA